MKQCIFSLILPCYNEGTSLTASVSRIYRVLSALPYSFEILFVDDKSTDATLELLKKICKKYPHCRIVTHAVNQGRGAAVMTGTQEARGRFVGYMDIDCEVSPVYLAEIIPILVRNEADFVIGKRVYRSSIVSFFREILSVGYKIVASMILKTRGIDTESGYKFFRKQKLKQVLSCVRDRHWFWDTEIVVRAIEHQIRIHEYPVLFLRRPDKKSSVRVIHDTFEYCRAIVRFRRQSPSPSTLRSTQR